jgi:NitT/TauT family transport system substrate-binding protein
MKRRTFTAGAAALALGMMLPGGAARAEAQGPARKLTFVTDWKAEAEHGGFYQAIATGLYARRGLDVTLRQGGVGMDPQRLLAAGAVDMALGSNSFFQLNLTQAGADVVSVAAFFAKDPTILMTHPRPDVTSLADLKGRPIMIGDPSVTTMWAWLKAKFGYEDRQIRKYTFNLAPFLTDRNAVQQGYVTSEPYTAEKAGVKPQVFLLADAGYAPYGALVMVRGKLLQEKPELVRAFVEASAEGWASYLNGDPAPADALIKRDNPEMDDATLAFARAQMKRYGIVQPSGVMTEARWQSFVADVTQQGLYPAGLDWHRGVRLDLAQEAQR